MIAAQTSRRLAALGWVCACALCGCAGSGSNTATLSPNSPPTILPDESVQGRVVTVNVSLRYVVMDFPLRGLPELGQRLGVYREGQKIGEVKVTGPIMDTAAAGDIVAGQAAVGDAVRED